MLSSNDHQDLLAWYDEHQRDLPWRHTSDPWAILLSEILLQQTQVSRGIVYWKRMIDAFPTIESMATSAVDAVLKAWEGAGYYSRARRLHALSQRVMLPSDQGGFDGELPGTYGDLLSLPGIGPYTAAAVASIAFDQPVACVDGNIRRVMARHTAQSDPAPKAVQAWADSALVSERPGDWNQALMELGATVCTPRRVKCGGCPIQSTCQGGHEPERFPTPRKSRVKAVSMFAVVEIAADGRPVLHQRPLSGMFAGLWGPVYHETSSLTPDEDWLACGTVEHLLSHRKLTVQVYLKTTDVPLQGTLRSKVAISSLDEKVLAVAVEHQHAEQKRKGVPQRAKQVNPETAAWG